jgi:heat shock protein HtpX
MHSEIIENKRKSVVILAGFFVFAAILLWVMYMYSESYPLTFGVLVAAIAYAAFSYYGAGKMAVAVHGAQEVNKQTAPRLYRTVENLAITEGLPMPKVYVMDDPAPNAFATGRDPQHAIVCATTGLLDIMDDSELEGVMAHELGHVKNYDIRVSMLAFGLTVAISLIADTLLRMFWWRDSNNNRSSSNGVFMVVGFAAAILAPLIATIIRMAISRQREYLADATGAMTTRYPEGLARALEKLHTYGTTLQKPNTSTAHMFISNPLSKSSLSTLFSTHPPIEERVKILRGMEHTV